MSVEGSWNLIDDACEADVWEHFGAVRLAREPLGPRRKGFAGRAEVGRPRVRATDDLQREVGLLRDRSVPQELRLRRRGLVGTATGCGGPCAVARGVRARRLRPASHCAPRGRARTSRNVSRPLNTNVTSLPGLSAPAARQTARTDPSLDSAGGVPSSHGGEDRTICTRGRLGCHCARGKVPLGARGRKPPLPRMRGWPWRLVRRGLRPPTIQPWGFAAGSAGP